MAGSLEGPLAKWARAEAKLASLKAEVDADWPPHKVWPVYAKPDRTGREYRFHLGELPAIKPEWALEAGDILFNLRSALDHLAYQLHVRRWRGNVPKKSRGTSVEGTTQFPIYDTPDGWDRNAYRIATLSRRDRSALEHLQPYITRHDRWEWHRYWLSRLNTWHNIDKHRKLHLVTGAKNSSIIAEPVGAPGPYFPIDAGFIYGPMKTHSHVETWAFPKAPPQAQPHPGVFLHVALEHGGEYDRLCDVALYATMRRVREIIERFADRF